MASFGGMWTSDVVVGRNADGRMEMFIVGADGRMCRQHQTAPNNGWAGNWLAHRDDLTITFYHERIVFDPATARLSVLLVGNALWVFGRTTRGRIVYTRQQPGEPGGWTDWKSIAAAQDEHPVMGNPVAAGPWNFGVYVRGAGGGLLTWRNDLRPLDEWQSGTSLGGISLADPAASHSDSAFAVVVVGTDGRVWWKGSRTARHSMHLSSSLDLDWRVVAASASLPDGAVRLLGATGGVVWRGLDRNLWLCEPHAFGEFSDPAVIAPGAVSEPTVAVDTDGRTVIAWIGSGRRIFLANRPPGAARFGDPVDIGFDDALGTPGLQFNLDGRLEVICRRTDAALHHAWEVGPGHMSFGR